MLAELEREVVTHQQIVETVTSQTESQRDDLRAAQAEILALSTVEQERKQMVVESSHLIFHFNWEHLVLNCSNLIGE
jgi:hypothetical protein